MTDQLDGAWRRFVATRTEAAFRHLYAAMSPKLYRFAYCRLAGDVARAQDATQETWCRVVASAGFFAGRSSASTWIMGIALNVCREISREDGPPAEPRARDADSYTPDSARMLDLANGLGKLAECYREVLLLHDLAGLTHDEISALMGIGVGTSKSQLSRARFRLREQLKDAADDPGTGP